MILIPGKLYRMNIDGYYCNTYNSEIPFSCQCNSYSGVTIKKNEYFMCVELIDIKTAEKLYNSSYYYLIVLHKGKMHSFCLSEGYYKNSLHKDISEK